WRSLYNRAPYKLMVIFSILFLTPTTPQEPNELLSTLVERSKQGDPEAFTQLVIKYRPWVFSIVLSRLPKTQDCEDIVQECFHDLWRDIRNLHNPAAFFGWFKQLVVHKCQNWRRNLNVRQEVFFSDLSKAEQRQLEQQLMASEVIPDSAEIINKRDQILNIICKLPIKYREVLLLYYTYDYSRQDISRILELSLKAVDMRLYRGKQLFCKQLTKLGLDDIPSHFFIKPRKKG
ncbi:MAG: RNA polymerase sigma factor, partial [bacterium]|nr:RNA polymerase sigma factor [bacterium]